MRIGTHEKEVVLRHGEDDAPEGGRGVLRLAVALIAAAAASEHVGHEARVAAEQRQAEREQVLAAEVLQLRRLRSHFSAIGIGLHIELMVGGVY